MNKPVYDKFLQIGIVVRDAEKSAKFYEEVLGIGPWDMGELGTHVPVMHDLKMDGKEVPENTCIMKTAMTVVYGMEIELIEPTCPSQYLDWLNEHGPGIHHICLYSKDQSYDDLLAKSTEVSGKDPWVRFEAINGLMDVSYVDFREEAGILLEIFRNFQPGKPVLPYDVRFDNE